MSKGEINPEYLTRRFLEVLRVHGPFRNYIQGKGGPTRLDFYEGVAGVSFHGVDQFFSFAPTDRSSLGFYVHTAGLNGSNERAVRDALNLRDRSMKGNLRRSYGDLLTSLATGANDLEFRHETIPGITVRAEVAKVPVGDRGGISHRIFGAGYNLIMVPTWCVKKGVDLKEGRSWVSLTG